MSCFKSYSIYICYDDNKKWKGTEQHMIKVVWVHVFTFNSTWIFDPQKCQSHRLGLVQAELVVNCLFSCSFWAGENVPSPSTERFQRLLFWPLRAPGSLVCHHDLWSLQTSVLGGMSEMFTFSETDGVQVAPFFPIWDVFLSQVLRCYHLILSLQCSNMNMVEKKLWWQMWSSIIKVIWISNIQKWSDLRFTITIYYST